MPTIYEGNLIGQGLRIGIVVSRFNELITGKLLEGALDGLRRRGVEPDGVSVAWVPGSFEIPFVAQKMARSGQFDAVICLGTLIRGSTSHYDVLIAEVTKGVAQAAGASGVPVVFGVLTCDTIEQAIERAGTKMGNKGFDAAGTAIEMANLAKVLDAAW